MPEPVLSGDPHMHRLLHQAKAIFILPKFGHGGFIFGGRAGEGLLLAYKPDGTWSDPVFYSLSGGSVGAQIGASYGLEAYLLMNDRALSNFRQGGSFSFNGNGAFNVVRYSIAGTWRWNDADVVRWSNTAGGYIGATATATDISWDQAVTTAYYGDPHVTIGQILDGRITSAQDNALQRSLRKTG